MKKYLTASIKSGIQEILRGLFIEINGPMAELIETALPTESMN